MRWFWTVFAVLLLNTAYVSAVHPATVFYMGNVLLHLLLGIALSVFAILLVRQKPWLAILLGASVLGLYLALAGNTSDHKWILWSHITVGILAVFLIAAYSA